MAYSKFDDFRLARCRFSWRDAHGRGTRRVRCTGLVRKSKFDGFCLWRVAVFLGGVHMAGEQDGFDVHYSYVNELWDVIVRPS